MEALVERNTFAAGEVSPVLRMRSDLQRQGTALWFAENVVVLPEGGVTRRPGTQFLTALKDVAQPGLLIPFRFAVDDVLILVFNAGVMRILANGGLLTSPASGGVAPFELAIPYAAADLPNVRFAQSGNFVFFACAGKQPRILQRLSSDVDWTIGPYLTTGGPVDKQNIDQSITIEASAFTGDMTLTGVGTNWTPGLVGGVFKLAMADINDVPIWIADDSTLAVGDERQFQGNVYEVTALGAGNMTTGPTPPTHLDGSVTIPTGSGSSGAPESVTWKFLNPGYGYVRVTGFTNPTLLSATFIAPAGSTTWQLPDDVTDEESKFSGKGGGGGGILVAGNGTYRWSPPVWDDDAGWPDQVMLFEDTLMWSRGDTFWRTTTGNFFDFDLFISGSSALTGSIISDDGSLIDIEWLQHAGPVLVGGRDGEFIIRGPDIYDPLTADNIRIVPDSYEGSCPHIPARAEQGTLFIGRDRTRMHHVKFQPLTERSELHEVTATARHILATKAVRVAWQRDPNHVAWICCQDGGLRSLTYFVEQQVIGWARHPMINGAVEDLCALQSPDNTVTQIFMIVRRVVNGVTQRYVETLTPYFPIVPASDVDGPQNAGGAWHLDCGAQYIGPPATVIGGLDFLVGQTVLAHTDGYMQGPFVVSPAGTITLPNAAQNVVVGLPMPWRARTVPYDLSTGKGSTKGAKKRANEVKVDMVNSAGGRITVNPQVANSPTDDMQLTGGNAYAGAIPLFSGTKRFKIRGASDNMLQVEIGASDTMPFTLTGIAPDVIIEEQP